MFKIFNIMKKKTEETEFEKKLANLKTYIRKTLKENGLYKKEMTHQVELTASTLLIFRKIRDDILVAEEPPMITEVSREGESRKKENPIYNLYGKFADLLRRDLRALKMNQELTRGREDKDEMIDSANDPLKKLMQDLDEEEDNE